MDKKSFIFSIDQSLIFKINDINYKISNYSKNYPLLFISAPLFHIRFLVISLGNYTNPNLSSIRALVGICFQVCETVICRFNKILGFPAEIEKINFFQGSRSKLLNYFLFYCSDLNFQKLTLAGLLGNFFFFLRLFISDIFSFFGGEFYKSFYINYFGFSEIFAFDFFFDFMFSIRQASFRQKIFQLKNFLSFSKLSL